jgi:hypothetical protein
VCEAPPLIEAQIGQAHLPVILDSGSAVSIMSSKHLEQLSRDHIPSQLTATQVKCVSASGQSLDIIGEVQVALKIHGFSWPWRFVISNRLTGHPILGVDFISMTKMVLDIGESRCYFGFAPTVVIPLKRLSNFVGKACSRLPPLRCRQIRCGELTAKQRVLLENIIQEFLTYLLNV